MPFSLANCWRPSKAAVRELLAEMECDLRLVYANPAAPTRIQRDEKHVQDDANSNGVDLSPPLKDIALVLGDAEPILKHIEPAVAAVAVGVPVQLEAPPAPNLAPNEPTPKPASKEHAVDIANDPSWSTLDGELENGAERSQCPIMPSPTYAALNEPLPGPALEDPLCELAVEVALLEPAPEAPEVETAIVPHSVPSIIKLESVDCEITSAVAVNPDLEGDVVLSVEEHAFMPETFFARLPYEMLVEIMLAVSPPNTSVESNRNRIESALLLSSICSLWRRIALNLPRLWVLTFITSYPTMVYTLFVERSKPLSFPVSLTAAIPFPQPMKTANGLDPDPRIPVTSQHATGFWLGTIHRWSSLTVPTSTLHILSAIPAYFPCLEKLDLKLDGGSHRTLTLFKTAPLLTDVVLSFRGTHKQPIPTLFPLPWTQLTSVNLQTPAPYEALHLMVRCPNLKTLFVRRHNDYPWRGSDNPSNLPRLPDTVRLPKLDKLAFSTSLSSARLDELFGALHVPALSLLAVFADEYHGAGSTTTFVNFLERTPSLKAFALLPRSKSNLASGPGSISENLLKYLPHMPNLRQLDLVRSCIDDALLRGLQPRKRNTIVPRLRNIDVFDPWSHFDAADIVNLIMLRGWEVGVGDPVARWQCRLSAFPVSEEQSAYRRGGFSGISKRG